jgi:adenine-specific DNA-methyltransferase
MPTNLEKFRELLKELFQLDQADLDFGIYRIMNTRRDEILRFLDNDLLPQVNSAFAEYQSADKALLQAQVDDAIKNARGLGVDPDQSPRVNELRQKLAAGSTDIAALENTVFSHLFNFFRRYYQDGDFISLRRYKEGVYAIPYEGEEVKLYWANHDQYYIKSSEAFRDYTFKLDSGKRVNMRIVAASTEQNNNKEAAGKERRFVLCTDNPIAIENGELHIRFEYRPSEGKEKQGELNQQAIAAVLNAQGFDAWIAQLAKPAPTENDPTRTVLAKHLAKFTARNEFDYFIHKDLGGFLRRELDFYIKNEVMHLDDIENESAQRVEQYLSLIKVIRKIAHKIIAFLEQLENFQKKLWLKKKFVIDTQYCMTLDRVPEDLYGEIAANDAQREEWIKLFAIDEIKAEKLGEVAYTKPLTAAFLKSQPHLVLDTKHFSAVFKQKLLASIDNLDEKLDGLLIHSENFQALRLINERYREKIDCVYIDPPFNLGETADYMYRVDYKNSTWLSLIGNRLDQAKSLIAPEGSVFARCSHDGNMLLRMLMEDTYGPQNYRNEIIVRRAEESKGDLNKQFASTRSITVNYDNIYWFSVRQDARFGRFMKPTTGKQADAHWHGFWKAEDRPSMRYELLGVDLKAHYGQWMWGADRASAAVENYRQFCVAAKQSGVTLEEYWESTGKKLEFIKREGKGISSVKYWIPPRAEVMADNNWLDVKGYSNKWEFKTENSEPLLRRIVESITREKCNVLDFFAGSGTTCAAAHKLRRRWIGVEMGTQFYSVVVPRMKAVLHGDPTGISEMTNWRGGGAFKYLRLESYEDALANLELNRTAQQSDLLAAEPVMREQYMLSYMLDVESRASQSLLNIAAFGNPDQYQLKVEKNGETQTVNVDLPETFNYLLGLTVKHIDLIRGVRVIDGSNPKGDRVLVLWRNVDEMNNDQLDAWFQKQGYNTREMDYDIFYVNGDNNLENLRHPDQTWKVRLIEEDFQRLMFDVGD